MDLFDVKGVGVGDGDDGDFGNAVLFEDGELVLCFDPEGLFALERSGDDEFMGVGDISVYAKRFEGYGVFDEGKGDHAVELDAEGLSGGEVFGKGEVVHDHLPAATLDGIVYEVEQTLLLKALDGAIDEIFGDTEVLLGEAVDLVGGHRLGVVACQNEDERLFVGGELLLEELLHCQCRVFGVACHSRQGAAL